MRQFNLTGLPNFLLACLSRAHGLAQLDLELILNVLLELRGVLAHLLLLQIDAPRLAMGRRDN